MVPAPDPRRLAASLAVAAYPALWFVYRDAATAASSNEQATALPLGPVVEGGSGIVVGAAAGTVLGLTLWFVAGSLPAWARPLSTPPNRTLGAFVGLSLAFWLGIALGLPDPFANWGRLAFEVVFLWPAVLAYLAVILVGNAVVGEPSVGIQFFVVGVGMALSAAWLLLLSGWLATTVRRRLPSTP